MISVLFEVLSHFTDIYKAGKDMEKEINKLKGLYMRRISLYEDLLCCIKKESDNLINRNIKGIWASLDEKKDILEAIEENNNLFPENKSLNPALSEVTGQDRDAVIQLTRTLGHLKMEISTRTKENVSFINDTLGFINDIFSALGNKEKKADTYAKLANGQKNRRSESTNLIYRNEV